MFSRCCDQPGLGFKVQANHHHDHKNDNRRDELTSPSVESDLLMLAASRRRSPFAPVALALSDPARSTKQILLVLELIRQERRT